MDAGRVEHRHRAVLGPHQQHDLGAAQDDRLGPARRKVVDQLDERVSRLVGDDVPTQLAEDDRVGPVAAGLVGATVMPHAVYVHSRLLGQRAAPLAEPERRGLLRAQRVDIPVAMGLAGLVNISILLTANAVFHSRGVTADTIQQAHAGIADQLGPGIALCFALSLLASGLASSSVGTLSGQIVMSGFLGISLRVTVRRIVTLTPALLLLALGVDATTALIDSQVVLSFGLPFALVPLVLLTRDPGVMGSFVNRRRTTVAATVVVTLVVALDLALVGPVLLSLFT